MSDLQSIYGNLLNEAWSKTIASNGKNTLIVDQQVAPDPGATYYVFIVKPFFTVRPGSYKWQTSPVLIKSAIGDDAEKWNDIEYIKDRLVKGSDIISFVRNKESKTLSGLTQYILDLRNINRSIKGVIYAELFPTKSYKNYISGFLFVNAGDLGKGVPNTKIYYEIVEQLDIHSKIVNNPFDCAREVLPFIEEFIKVKDTYQQGTQTTGGDWDISGLAEGINLDEPFPYGKVQDVLSPSFYHYPYTAELAKKDLNFLYTVLAEFLIEVEEAIPEPGQPAINILQAWWDNMVENYYDSGMISLDFSYEDAVALAEGRLENIVEDFAKGVFIKEYIKAHDLYKQGTQDTGGDWDISGLAESKLNPDMYSEELFNFLTYTQNWPHVKEFTDWLINNADEHDADILNYTSNRDENWLRACVYFDSFCVNAYHTSKEVGDPSVIEYFTKQVKGDISRLYKQFLVYYNKLQDTYRQGTQATGGDWDISGLAEKYEILLEQPVISTVDGSLKFGKYIIFKDTTTEYTYDDAVNNGLISSATLINLKQLEEVGYKFEKCYKTVYGGTGVYGKDPDGEEMIYTRKAGPFSSPIIYYMKRRGGSAIDAYRHFYAKYGKTETFTVEDFLNSTVTYTWLVTPKKPNGYRAKKITIRPDKKIDVIGNIYISFRVSRNYKVWVLNSTKDIPADIKFGKVNGDLTIELPIDDLSWFPEKVKGNVQFSSNTGYDPLKVLQAGIPEKVDGLISFSGFNLPGEEWGTKKFTPDDWVEYKNTLDIYQQGTQSTGGEWNISGLAESIEDKHKELLKNTHAILIKALDADNFEDFKAVASTLPDIWYIDTMGVLGNLYRNTIQEYTKSDQLPSPFKDKTPGDNILNAIYNIQDTVYGVFTTKKDSDASLKDAKRYHNNWLDWKAAQKIYQQGTQSTGGQWDISGLQ